MTLWSGGPQKSCDKQKSLYFHYRSVHDQVTYLEGLLSIKSHSSWITWSREIMWQIKIITFYYHNAYGHQIWQDGDFAWQTKNIIYLHNQFGAYGYQTWEDFNLLWWAPVHKVIWCFDHLVLEDNVTKQNHNILHTKVPMTTKLDRIVTYFEGLLPIKSFDAFTIWLVKSHEQTKPLHLHYYSSYSYQNLREADLPWLFPTHKFTWPSSHIVLENYMTI